MALNFYVKTHGLGNEYAVFKEDNINFRLDAKAIQRICNTNYGIGTDGILLYVPSSHADYGVKIYNPDGSEAEKSGNGLRIFCKYLFDYGYANKKQFSVETLGGIVQADIIEERNGKAFLIQVDIGKAEFNSRKIPVDSDKPEFLNEKIEAGGKPFIVHCVSVGNPHCVVIKDKLDIEEIKQYGTFLENHNLFPNRINVQFARPVSDHEVEAIIWERGAGYTLASGTSSSAVACITHKLGYVKNNITVKMPGGDLNLFIDTDWNIRLTGEVREITSGHLSPELIEDLEH